MPRHAQWLCGGHGTRSGCLEATVRAVEARRLPLLWRPRHAQWGHAGASAVEDTARAGEACRRSVCAGYGTRTLQPLIPPSLSSFKLYHSEHHRYQGKTGIDADVPTPLQTLFSPV